MPKALRAKVWLGLMPKVFCIMVGVMTTSTTTAEVSTQVRIIAGNIASAVVAQYGAQRQFGGGLAARLHSRGTPGFR